MIGELFLWIRYKYLFVVGKNTRFEVGGSIWLDKIVRS